MIDFWDGKSGFNFSQDTGTNIVQWSGIQGSGYPWTKLSGNGVNTNYPPYVNTITTNGFPAINFPAGGLVSPLYNNRIATDFFATGQPFTIVMLTCAESSGVAINATGFGYSFATNNNANIFRAHLHVGTPTSFGYGFGFSTNQALVNVVSGTGGPNTNRFNWYMMSYSNGTAMVMHNLLGSQSTITSPGSFQFNSLTLGARAVTNFNINGAWSGFVGAYAVGTNALFGTHATNFMNYVNGTYRGGAYRVYNGP